MCTRNTNRFCIPGTAPQLQHGSLIMTQAAEGWGRLSSQLYQNHWETQEHSGWSDDDEHDPDMMQPHTGNVSWRLVYSVSGFPCSSLVVAAAEDCYGAAVSSKPFKKVPCCMQLFNTCNAVTAGSSAYASDSANTFSICHLT